MNQPVWALPSVTGTKYYCAEHEDFMKFWSDKPRLATKEDRKWFKRDSVYCERCLYLDAASWGRGRTWYGQTL